MTARRSPAKQAKTGSARTPGGQFPKGTSGNPNGRKPKGLATVEKLRGKLADELDDIIGAVVQKAIAGDMGACKLILERVLPPLKPAELAVFLGAVAGTRTEQGEAILQGVAAGTLAPGQAAQLLGALASQAKVVEVDEIERRLSKLEDQTAT